MERLPDLRAEYMFTGLLETEADSDPMAQFRNWFREAEAAGIEEANAMSLATATPDGMPSVRMVLLKGVDHGFLFFTNYESRKARELDANPFAAVCFHWKELERQIRIHGTVERVSRQESDSYFRSRPRGSQIGAWASRQSSAVASRDQLERDYEEYAVRFRDVEVPLPEAWGGYRLIPSVIEFWQGRPNRLHDRLIYEHSPDGWIRRRLAP